MPLTTLTTSRHAEERPKGASRSTHVSNATLSIPHVFDDADQLADGADRFVERRLFFIVERDFDHPFDPAGADYDGNADIDVFDPVLAVEPRRAGQNAFLVTQIGFRHLDRRTGRRVESRTGFQQADDFAAALAGALDDLVEPLLGRPAHLDEVGQRDPGDGRIAHQRHHRVAMATEHKGSYVLDRNPELLCQEIAEPGAVEDPGHADDAMRR